MECCDVLIVGGGPAGSSCAWGLRQAGLDVLVLDKRPFPRDKPCAGWITPEVTDLLQIDILEYGRGCMVQPITGFRVSRIGGREIETDYGRTISYGIRRCEFDQYLLNRCKARVREGAHVRVIEPTTQGWLVDNEIEARLIVGAGGHFCPVARLPEGRSDGAEQAVTAQVVEFEMTRTQARACSVRPEVPELYFCEDLRGYGWCVRKGDYLNVGLGREDTRQLPNQVRAFVEFLQSRGRMPRLANPRFQGHAYLLYSGSHRAPVRDRMLLVGDAAGLASAYSGEGIRTAVESGLMAAQSIVDAAGDYAAARLQSYADELIARFGPPGTDDSLLSHLPASIKLALAGPFFASRTFVRRIVLDRWFLHSGKARARPAACTAGTGS